MLLPPLALSAAESHVYSGVFHSQFSVYIDDGAATQLENLSLGKCELIFLVSSVLSPFPVRSKFKESG